MKIHDELHFDHTLEKDGDSYWCSSCFGRTTRADIDAGVWMKVIGTQCMARTFAYKEKESHT